MKLLGITTVFVILCNDCAWVLGDVGTGTSYGPPYAPTSCYGNSQDEFPPGNLLARVSEGLWDNGAACGRRYRVKCLSGPNKPCKDGSVDVQVVDACSTRPCPSNLVLSREAFSAISRALDAKINVEYLPI